MARLGISVTWLGHSAFHLQPSGATPGILIDPWLANPNAPASATALARQAGLILVTHAHFDHVTGVTDLARETGAKVLTSFEVAAELEAEGLPAEQVVGFNKGGTATAHGVSVTLTQAIHSSSLPGPDGRARSIGEPCGLIIEIPDGPVIYDTGDTCVFGDMALLAAIYRPSILMLPIGDFYTMGPREAAKACELLSVPRVIPMHWGTFPALVGTPKALKEEIAKRGGKTEVIDLAPGQSWPKGRG